MDLKTLGAIITEFKNYLSKGHELSEYIKREGVGKLETEFLNEKIYDIFTSAFIRNLDISKYKILDLDFFELVSVIKRQLKINVKKYMQKSDEFDFGFPFQLSIELLLYINKLEGYKFLVKLNENYEIHSFEFEMMKNIMSSNVNMLDRLNQMPLSFYISWKYPKIIKSINTKMYFGDYSFNEWLLQKSDRNFHFSSNFYGRYFGPYIDRVNLYKQFLVRDRNVNTHTLSTRSDFIDDISMVRAALDVTDNMAFPLSQKGSMFLMQKNNQVKHEMIISLLYLYLVYNEMINTGLYAISWILFPSWERGLNQLNINIK